MKIFLLFLIFSLALISCNFNTKCKGSESLLGRYKLDYSLLTSYNNNDTTILSLVRKNSWNKVILIVEKNKYYFEGCEEYFRKYEGTWEYKPIGIDGDCYIFINQKESSQKLPLGSFSIAIKANDKVIILPFKKIL